MLAVNLLAKRSLIFLVVFMLQSLITTDSFAISEDGALTIRIPATAIVNLTRKNNGHFYVSALVNQKPIDFLVDTGATKTVLPITAATKVGLAQDESTRAMYNTVNGQIPGWESLNNELQLGDKKIQNFNVVVVMTETSPLLGMDILSQFTIIMHNETMTIALPSSN